MFKKLIFVAFPLMLMTPAAQAGVSDTELDCLFNWAERTYSQLFAPAPAASQAAGAYYFRRYDATNTYLGIDKDTQHVVYLPASGRIDLGDVAPFVASAGCSASTPASSTSYAGTWTWSAGAYYSVQFVLTQDGNTLTAKIPSTNQHFTGKLSSPTTAVFTEDDGIAAAQATVTLISANSASLRMDSCTGMCMLQAGSVITLSR